MYCGKCRRCDNLFSLKEYIRCPNDRVFLTPVQVMQLSLWGYICPECLNIQKYSGLCLNCRKARTQVYVEEQENV